MTPILRIGLSVLLAFATAGRPSLRAAADEYPPHPDAVAQTGVPKGDLIKFDFTGSKIFPGTIHEVTLYVPKQYDPAKPACVYVNQDGVQWNAPVVFDNLIARKELPVLIGVFVRPGVVKSADPAHALDRFNRSYEYDGQGDADGMRVDRDGRLYVATRLGIQICDQAGRVNAILSTPNRRVANVVFGGEKFDVLFATCGDKVFKRKLKTTGANAWDVPNKPMAPRL